MEKVTGVSEGNATITVRTSNGKTASCKVTVIEQVPSVIYQTHIERLWLARYKKRWTDGRNKWRI
ncbi:MAG: hypothetical protein ACLTAI_13970 [Thomasclavelia sp.]